MIISTLIVAGLMSSSSRTTSRFDAPSSTNLYMVDSRFVGGVPLIRLRPSAPESAGMWVAVAPWLEHSMMFKPRSFTKVNLVSSNAIDLGQIAFVKSVQDNTFKGLSYNGLKIFGLLGVDFLRNHSLVIDFKYHTVFCSQVARNSGLYVHSLDGNEKINLLDLPSTFEQKYQFKSICSTMYFEGSGFQVPFIVRGQGGDSFNIAPLSLCSAHSYMSVVENSGAGQWYVAAKSDQVNLAAAFFSDENRKVMPIGVSIMGIDGYVSAAARQSEITAVGVDAFSDGAYYFDFPEGHLIVLRQPGAAALP